MTHGGVLGMLLCHVLGMDIQRRWQFRRDNTAIFEFDIGDDYCIVMRANDISASAKPADRCREGSGTLKYVSMECVRMSAFL